VFCGKMVTVAYLVWWEGTAKPF